MYDASRAAGYDWPPARIYKAMSEVIARHGEAAVEKAWRCFLRDGPQIEGHPKWMTPQHFAAKVGFWIQLSLPYVPR